MITRQVWLKTVLAVILSICIAFYVNQFFQSLSHQVEVVIAAEFIPAQTRITKNMIKTIKVNQEDRAKLVPNAMVNLQDAIGMIALVPLKQGEVLQVDTEKLVSSDQSSSIQGKIGTKLPKSFFIPSDQRAISLKLDSEGSLDFSLKQGDIVDVIFTSVNGDTGGIFTKTILRKVSIFEVSDISEKDKQSGNSSIMQSITLLVSPDQAELLTLAKRKGKVDLVLTPKTPDAKEWDINEPTYPSDFTIQGALNR